MIILLIAIVGQIADVITTWLAIKSGGIEANPLFGTNPNLWLILLIKLIVIAFAFFLLKGMARTRVLTFGAIIGFGAAGWNLYVFQTGI